MDLSGSANQFTDFSPDDSHEVSEDCGCYGPPRSGNCNKIYAPVLGCDGIIYHNECVALRNGIYIYKRREYRKPPVTLPCPTTPPIVVQPSPANPPIVTPQPTNSAEVKPWPNNPRKPPNNKPPQRGGATLIQTPRHKRK